MDKERLSAYEYLGHETIGELKSEGYLLEHKKTGARVVLLENDDENKVFYIGFRTPPKESTGVMHILEHSVLCGSKNYPVKDPFIELAKGSLNTFLNAMTYPDKTVYPVASCNDKDFRNLMNVYLDAVFYPRILDSDKTFRQEGWHYELNSKEDELKVNGVVYSEMKGAFSNPDDVFERSVLSSLFPDNTYSEESGGDPKCIPELTYEHYLEVYRQYYHPSNSYIYLYGNMDMNETLEFIDSEYLSAFDRINIDSSIPHQEAFEKRSEVVRHYSITEDEPLDNNTYLSLNFAFDTNLNPMSYIAWDVIDYALCSAQGAVLKEALLEAGIGSDVYSDYDNGIRQPIFSIVAKGTNETKKQEFLDIIDKTIDKIIAEGFDKDTLRAGLNELEFKYREADFGSYPPGLMYGLQVLDSWLYDDRKPFIHIHADATYKALREAIDSDYYEQLLKSGIKNNTHCSLVIVKPEVDLAVKEEQEYNAKLQEYKKSLSDEELDRLIIETKELIEYQEAEDDPETLKCIPVLGIEDINKKARKPVVDLSEVEGMRCIYHPIYTNGIDYIRLIFDISGINKKYYQYLTLYKAILGLVDTENYTYGELYNKIFMETGGISNAINYYEQPSDDVDGMLSFEWKGKCLSGDIDKVFKLIEEITLRSIYTDKERILDILRETKSHMQETVAAQGHVVAKVRALSHVSRSAALSDRITGIEFMHSFEDLLRDFENEADNLIKIFCELTEQIFTRGNLILDFAGSEEEFDTFKIAATDFASKLKKECTLQGGIDVEVRKINEGFTNAGKVQYVCAAGNFSRSGLKYTGALKVLRVIMGYDYLWNNIRVKGGAYGCMSGFNRNGDSHFVSYRDPNLTNTIEVYKGIREYLDNFSADDRAMTQYIIGAISAMDMPMSPANLAIWSLSAYLGGVDYEMLQKERDEVLGSTVEVIRSLSEYTDAVMKDYILCVVGNSDTLKKEKSLFDKVEPLLRG